MDEACRLLDATETNIKKSLRQGEDYGYLIRSASRWSVTPLGRQQLAGWGRLEGVDGLRFARYITGWRQHKLHPRHRAHRLRPIEPKPARGMISGHPN
jgi:hypothetical protein